MPNLPAISKELFPKLASIVKRNAWKAMENKCLVGIDLSSQKFAMFMIKDTEHGARYENHHADYFKTFSSADFVKQQYARNESVLVPKFTKDPFVTENTDFFIEKLDTFINQQTGTDIKLAIEIPSGSGNVSMLNYILKVFATLQDSYGDNVSLMDVNTARSFFSLTGYMKSDIPENERAERSAMIKAEIESFVQERLFGGEDILEIPSDLRQDVYDAGLISMAMRQKEILQYSFTHGFSSFQNVMDEKYATSRNPNWNKSDEEVQKAVWFEYLFGVNFYSGLNSTKYGRNSGRQVHIP